MNLEWLSTLRLFFRSEEEGFLFIGNPDAPRSTIIRITDCFENTQPFPTIQEERLVEKFNSNITIYNCNLKPHFKFLLSILLRKRVEIDTLEYDLTINQWIENATQFQELKFLVKILIGSTRVSRQHALNKLVKMQNKTSQIILSALIDTKDEITSSIFRELGRYNTYITYMINYAHNRHTEESSVGFYCRLYLLNHNVLSWNDVLDLESSILLIKDHVSFTKMRMRIQRNPKTALEGMVIPALTDLPTFGNIVNILASHSFLTREYRASLMRLIKYAECLNSPELVAGIYCLTLVGRSAFIYRDEQRIELDGEQFLKYPRQRLNNLLQIWVKNAQPDLIDRFLQFLVLHIPKEKKLFHKTRFKYINVEEWLETIPILHEFAERIQLILYNNFDLLRKLLIHLSRVYNLHFHTWIFTLIDHELLKEILGELTPNDKLYTYASGYYYPPDFNLLNQLKKKKDELKYSDFAPTKENLKHTLGFYYRMRYRLPIDIIQLLVKFMHTPQYKSQNIHKLLLKYFDKVLYRDENQVFNFAETIKNQIFDSSHSNCKYCVIQLFYLKNWKKLTGHTIPDSWLDTITGIEIVNKKVLGKISVDAITPLQVETIITTYKLLKGKIHQIIEENIQFALNKYNWDQLARHYLALGLERPNRDALIASELRKIPKLLLRDQLGRIALVSQTIKYGMQNGFTPSLENVIIQNIYLRGWNIDNKLQSKLSQIIGSVSFKFRSFIAAYLILEKSEMSNEILLMARDVASKVIRDRLLRTLERFGGSEMWYILAGSSFEDLSEPAIEQLKRLRLSKEDRIRLIQTLLNADKLELRELAVIWMDRLEFIDNEQIPLFVSSYEDIWEQLSIYYTSHRVYFLESYHYFPEIIDEMIWKVASPVKTHTKLLAIAKTIPKLHESMHELSETIIRNRSNMIFESLAGEFHD